MCTCIYLLYIFIFRFVHLIYTQFVHKPHVIYGLFITTYSALLLLEQRSETRDQPQSNSLLIKLKLILIDYS